MAARILIVEDSAVIRERIRALLVPLPSIDVIGHAETADEAITAIDELSPDIVTLDIGLRDGNGFDVLRWLSENDGNRPEVVVLTLIEKGSILDQLANWNVSAVLDKSTDFERITGEVARLAAARTADGGRN